MKTSRALMFKLVVFISMTRVLLFMVCYKLRL